MSITGPGSTGYNGTASGISGFSNIGAVTGSSVATNTLTGDATGATYTISSLNGGTLQDTGSVQVLNFGSFQNLTGGAGNDTFAFTGGSLGGINGGSGNNALDYSGIVGPVTVTLTSATAGTASDISGAFSNIGNLTGSSSTADVLVGPNTADNWLIAGANAGNVNGFQFSSIENLTGGSSTDNFAFANGAGISGSINGGGGANTLDWSAYQSARNVGITGPGSLVGMQGTEASIGSVFDNITQVIGASGSTGLLNSLTGPNSTNTWNVTAGNTGNLDTVLAFSNFQNLNGGNGTDTFNLGASLSGSLSGAAGNDSFVFLPGGAVGGNIDGGAGINTLDYSALTGPVTLNLDTATASLLTGTFSNIGNLVGSAGNDTLTGTNAASTWTVSGANAGNVNGFTFSSIENLTGGNGANAFVLSGGSLSGNIIGGSGAAAGNSLRADNLSNTWSITGTNQGTVTGVGGTFANVGTLIGGTGADNFIFSNGASLSGGVNGGGVTAGNDTLNWNAYTSARNVTITGPGSVDGVKGTEASIVGGFDNITQMQGANGVVGLLNSLTGPNGTNTWNVTASNAGTLNGILDFSVFQTLTGGSGADTFNLSAGVSGAINGGTGADTANVVSSFTAPASTLAINNVETISDNAGATITAGSLAISGATGIGSASHPLLGNLGSLQISASNGNAFITTTGTVDLQGISLGSGALGLASGGAITDNGNLTVTANAVNLSAVSDIGTSGTPLQTATNTLTASVTGAGGLAVNNAGPLTLAAASTANGALDVSASGALTVSGPVTSGGNGILSLTTSSGNIAVNSSIAASGSGNVVVDAAGNLLISGSVSSLAGNLLLTGGTGVSASSGVQLSGGSIDVTAGNGNITLTGVTSKAGAGGSTLTATGNITVQNVTVASGALTVQNGGTFIVAGPLTLNAALTQTGAGGVDLNSSITGSGGAVQLDSPVSVASGVAASIVTSGGSISLQQSASGGSAASLTLSAGTGDITLNGASNLSNLTLQTGGTLSLAGATSVGSLNAIGVTGGIVIAGASTSLGTANSDVNLTAAAGINGATTGGQSLTISSGSGNVLLSPVGQTTPLAGLIINGGSITLAKVTTTGTQNYTGSLQLAGDLASTAGGAINMNGPVALLTNTVVSSSGGGGINVNGSLNGAQTLILNAATGDITLGGVVGGSTPLAGLTLNSATASIGTVATAGTQDYQSANTALAGTLNSSAGSINFGGTLTVTGNSTLQADSIGFNGGSASLKGAATLVILPETLGTTVNIGGSGSGLTLNNNAMDGYGGNLYIGAAPNGIGITVPVLVGNVQVNGNLQLGGSGTLLLAGMGNLTYNQGTLAAGTVILVAGGQNSVMQNPGLTQSLIGANTVVLVSGGQIGQIGQEINVIVPPTSSTAQVQLATGAVEAFLQPPTLPLVIGPAAIIADTIATELGLFIQSNTQVSSAGQQATFNAQTGGLLQNQIIDVSVFQSISLYDVFGLGIALPVDQCEEPASKLCHP
ncbi:MAG: S-layer family protein [Gammaproteobacteria bacterium]|nr:S-layer family protein [Gammaproteobacteria bacterium]